VRRFFCARCHTGSLRADTGHAMRSFHDPQGQTWQAAVLDASYGAALLVFTPLHGAGLRRLHLAVENYAAALDLLAGLDDAGLCARLTEAEPWDPTSDPS